MDLAEFTQLCRDTCVALNLPDTTSLADQHQIELNGIDIGLFYDEDVAGDRLVCYVDIGKLPEFDRDEIVESLLALNLLTGSKTSGVYGLDRRRDRVIFIQHFLYPDLMDGETLSGILHDYSKHALHVRRSLLDPTGIESGFEKSVNSFGIHSNELA